MNNDISGELSKYIGANVGYTPKKAADTPKVQSENVQSAKSYETAQEYYNALGRTKVNLDRQDITKRVSNSIDMLKQDPELVQNHVDLCDALQERGYSLEDAIIGTDIILEKLKDGSIYKS